MKHAGVIVAILALAAGAAGAFAWANYGEDEPAAAPIDRDEPAGSEPIRASQPPGTPPETVPATGACADAMASLRTLIASAQSGSLLDDTQNAQLTTGLEGLDANCAVADADAFRNQELVPWLIYAPLEGT